MPMGRGAQLGGRLLDMFIPGNAFNPNAPSFGQGWLSSGWGNGFRNAQQGQYGALGQQLGGVVGNRFLPIIGGQVGNRVGNWLGNALSNNGNWAPTTSYGPWADQYRGLPQQQQVQDAGIVPDFSHYSDQFTQGGAAAPSANSYSYGSNAFGTTMNGVPMSALMSMAAGSGNAGQLAGLLASAGGPMGGGARKKMGTQADSEDKTQTTTQ